jgi:hypothetical protein
MECFQIILSLDDPMRLQLKQQMILRKGLLLFQPHHRFTNKGRSTKSDFYYEQILYNSSLVPEFNNSLNHSFKHKHLWVKKGTGLGVTEFFLRLMAWLCLRNDDYKNSQMCIVTGPNIDIAIKLIKRMKSIFESNCISCFQTKRQY